MLQNLQPMAIQYWAAAAAAASYLQSEGKLLGKELIQMPARYISIEAYESAAGYFGNLSGWVTAPGMLQNLLVAVLLLVVLHTRVSSARAAAEYQAEAAALTVQHEKQLQLLRSEAAAARAAAEQDAEAARAEAAAAAAKREDAHTAEQLHAVKVAYTDMRLLAAEAPGCMSTSKLRKVKARNACLARIPTQSNQYVKYTAEGVHAVMRESLEQWLHAQLLLVAAEP
jgi:hypothetical protein